MKYSYMENRGLPQEKPGEQINKPEEGNFLSFPTDKKSLLNLAIFLVASSGVIGFLFYQNYQVGTSISTAPVMPPIRKTAPLPELDETAGWKTFRDEGRLYEFKYPEKWSIEETVSSEIKIYDENELLIISVNNVNFTVLGITYCAANPQDTSRCENLNVDGRPIGIDWGVNGTANAMLAMTDETGLSITLRQVNPQTKLLFPKILSTFKFLDSEPKKCLPVTQPCNPQSCDYDPVKCEGNN